MTPQAAVSKEPKKERTPRVDQAQLLRRTFALDVFTCAWCGGRRRVLAYLTAPNAVAGISRATFMAWDTTSDSVYDSQPYCNVSGYNLSLGGAYISQCRFGLIMNNENDCGTPDAAIGFGCYRSYDRAAIGSGSFAFSPWSVYPQRGWIYIR